MIKYSQGEIIVDLTSLRNLATGDTLDVSEILKDFLKENTYIYNGDSYFKVDKVMNKKLIILVKDEDHEIIKCNMSFLSDDGSFLRSAFTVLVEDTLYSYVVDLIASGIIEYNLYTKEII